MPCTSSLDKAAFGAAIPHADGARVTRVATLCVERKTHDSTTSSSTAIFFVAAIVAAADIGSAPGL